MKADDPLLTSEQIQNEFGISRTTVYLWTKQKLFPAPIKIGPRFIRWRRSVIEAWKSEQAKGNDR